MKKHVFATAAAAVLGMTALAVSAQADDTAKETKKAETEKCYGVVKAGQNDCGIKGKSACAGSSTEDGEAGAWVKVPAGLCDKLVGGSTEAPASE